MGSYNKVRIRDEETNLQSTKNKKYRVEKNFGDDFYAPLVEDTSNAYEDVMNSIDTIFWKEAINNKIQSIMQNQI